MKAKEYLQQAYNIDRTINIKLEQVEQYRSLACKITSSIKQDKVSSSSPKSLLEDSVIKIVGAEEDLNRSIDQLVDIKHEISKTIELLDNNDESYLLELRYLCFNTWEQVAVKMNFSMSNVYRIHQNAIRNMDKILADKRLAENE